MTKCELQENALLEVETIQGCKEMCLTVLDMCKRLNISDENDINFVAGIMQKHLKWTRKDTENQEQGGCTNLSIIKSVKKRTDRGLTFRTFLGTGFSSSQPRAGSRVQQGGNLQSARAEMRTSGRK